MGGGLPRHGMTSMDEFVPSPSPLFATLTRPLTGALLRRSVLQYQQFPSCHHSTSRRPSRRARRGRGTRRKRQRRLLRREVEDELQLLVRASFLPFFFSPLLPLLTRLSPFAPSRGGDTVEAMPPLDPRVTPAPNRRGASSSAGQSTKTIVPPLIRRSSAKEKFGGRLRSPEPPVDSRTKSRAGATSVAGGKRTVTPSNKP